MENNEIFERVSIELKKWSELQRGLGWSPEISEGAVDAISQMVINIEKDPSSYWREINTAEIQEYAIVAIPNVLNDIFLRFTRRHRPLNNKRITSWEIWHGISGALDAWCPIPKDF